MAADTSSAPAARSSVVGPNAAALAAPSVDPMFAKSEAALTSVSGAAITNDMLSSDQLCVEYPARVSTG
ncbi:Uncharacterised protein [Mycobacterium tuberculosis]|nr:hypothetical protein IU22_04255 [Mycobacterium tuberculosis]EQM18226.1 hypothetical protein GuangZ0019_3329 [Mycobacterium tuberculosis GuangZ0019]KAK27443.1 hypothetical protein AZ55_07850 [Mycobacterium tuberculosis CWCFVRF MDRTB 670]GAA45073.1 hypothetical protein NCGM2209_1693 [Mycobacterium tuberculosis NCGM2209]CFE38944.1 Uncharacterised protein [Mycobacterium tuberculosis]